MDKILKTLWQIILFLYRNLARIHYGCLILFILCTVSFGILSTIEENDVMRDNPNGIYLNLNSDYFLLMFASIFLFFGFIALSIVRILGFLLRKMF